MVYVSRHGALFACPKLKVCASDASASAWHAKAASVPTTMPTRCDHEGKTTVRRRTVAGTVRASSHLQAKDHGVVHLAQDTGCQGDAEGRARAVNASCL